MRWVWVVIPLILMGFIGVQDADARCVGPYPCSAPGGPILAAEIWLQSDTIVSGKIMAKSYGINALSNYDDTNPNNPCNLFASNEEFVYMLKNKTISLSEKLQQIEPLQPPTFPESLKKSYLNTPMEAHIPDRVIDQIRDIDDFLQNSELNAPFKIEIMIDTIYKGNNVQNKIDIFGIEKSKLFSQQFSHGYFVDPEIGEDVLLYLQHHDKLQFGSCMMSDIYKVQQTQGSLWKWNEDDFKPDIYPNDVKIPSLKEQSLYKISRVPPTILDLVACPIDLEPMYRLHPGTPFCVTSSTADKIEERGWAKRISYFWQYGYGYERTDEYKKLRELS